MLDIVLGKLDNGNRSILNKARAVNAFSASNVCSGLLKTYVPNVTSDTKNGVHCHMKDVKAPT